MICEIWIPCEHKKLLFILLTCRFQCMAFMISIEAYPNEIWLRVVLFRIHTNATAIGVNFYPISQKKWASMTNIFLIHTRFFRENNHWTWQGIAASEINVMQISVLHCSAENLTTCSNALIYLAVVQHILLKWALAFRLFLSVIPIVTYYVFYQGYWTSNIGVLGPVSLRFKMS